MTEAESYLREMEERALTKITFSSPEAASPYRRTVLRRLESGTWQAEHFTEQQAFHENFTAEALGTHLQELFPVLYRQAHFVTDEYYYDAKLSKKGKLLTNRSRNTSNNAVVQTHDRAKKYIIDADHLPPVFRELGVAGEDGRILRAKFDKFRQICRFTELLNDVLKNEKKEELHIVDFGCGKSYLTFVVYHYITQILHKKAYITGLDLKREVIEDCTRLSEKYGFENLKFLCMDVKDYHPARPVDMVITLHACDTATDYALAFAVERGAKYIFSVPCCQKEANAMLHTDSLSLYTDYGLIKERFAALTTDALRGKLLEGEGYGVDMVEFVDFDNSPKNLMIRAVRKKASADRFRAIRVKEQIQTAKEQLGVSITLEKLLENTGIEESKE